VEPAEELLRRLALNDERVLGLVLTQPAGAERRTQLTRKVELLVQLAGLLAVEAATPSLREAVWRATAAGATAGELVAVLVSIGPTIGVARVVSSAPRLAMAMGYDLEDSQVGVLDPRSAGE
jgi:signal transduction protein with GAF and PtsI domain